MGLEIDNPELTSEELIDEVTRRMDATRGQFMCFMQQRDEEEYMIVSNLEPGQFGELLEYYEDAFLDVDEEEL